MPKKAAYGEKSSLTAKIRVARGLAPAAVVIKNAEYLDVFSGAFRKGDVAMDGGTIVGIGESYEGKKVIDGTGLFLVPGFIDAHVHIESSLMTPARFAETVVPQGTTTAIWDPHEIANVKGKAGIDWALAASEGLALDVFVMVPSCVPSTSPALGFESSGADLRASDIEAYRSHPRVIGLAEMMNFPGLLNGDGDVMEKLSDYQDLKRDGHCPGLTGKDLNAYGVAGIHSCHESTTLVEAREKQSKGIHVLIREGSCAKDAHELLPILTPYSSACTAMCSDDRNPADIAKEGHINHIVEMALKKGIPAETAFRSASFGAASIYGLEDRGAIAPGYIGDVVLVKQKSKNSWADGFAVVDVYKNAVSLKEQAFTKADKSERYFSGKNLNLEKTTPETFNVHNSTNSEAIVRVIGVIPTQILTKNIKATLPVSAGNVAIDVRNDILKIAVLERHKGTGQKSVGFVQGFRIKRGAIATSINHDSHNVIVVGSSESLMAKATNRLIDIDGGIVVVSEDGQVYELKLAIGGLMTSEAPSIVASALEKLKSLAAHIGCELEEPFLQLSFLALPVIPSLKITDRGLVDVDQFKMVPVVIS